MRTAYTLRADDGDFVQPGILYRDVFSDADRASIKETLEGQAQSITIDDVVAVADGASIGVDKQRDLDRGFFVTDSGITVVGKGVLVTP